MPSSEAPTDDSLRLLVLDTLAAIAWDLEDPALQHFECFARIAGRVNAVFTSCLDFEAFLGLHLALDHWIIEWGSGYRTDTRHSQLTW